MKVTKRGFVVIGLTLLYLFIMLHMAGLAASEADRRSPAAKPGAARNLSR